MFLQGTNTSAGRRFACVLAMAGTVASFGAGAAQAAVMSFEGQQIRVTEFLDDPLDPDAVTAEEVVFVGDGVELPSFGTSEGGLFSFNIDIDATGMELVSNNPIPQAPGTFGFTFANDMNAVMRILTAQVTSSVGYTGITSDTVSVIDSGNGVVIDFANVGIASDARLRIDVTFDKPPSGVIPLPGAMPLALGGFALLAGLRRRKR